MTSVSVLDSIIIDKKKEISSLKIYRNNYKIVNSNFKNIFSPGKIAFIAELKPASPVKGEFQNPSTLENVVKDLVDTPISAISVLTDRHFNASIENINLVRKYTKLPILRKDFIIDELQVYESSFYEVSAILLIARILERAKLESLYNLSLSLGIEPVVEIYGLEDLEKISTINPRIILINNRNLETFEVDITHTEKMMKYIPFGVLVISASGISTRQDIEYLSSLGIDGVLIGESIMRAHNPKRKIMELMGLAD